MDNLPDSECPPLAWTSSCENLDFSEYWNQMPLKKEIVLGKELRKKKRKIYNETKQYDVVNIDFFKSLCDGKQPLTEKGKRKKQFLSTTKSNPDEIFSQLYKPSHCRSSKRSRKNGLKCPMRVLELAEPTKRQCIETWRNKRNILPAVMAERLKKQILNAKPVVEIPEAIKCFQRTKCARTGRKRIKAKPDKNILKDKEEGVYCSARLASKVARKLTTPLYIKLSPDLQKLSNVVTKDIVTMTKRKTCKSHHLYKPKFIAEVSDRVAIWIALILEDSRQRQLDQDLEDLELEEGSALDVLDDLFDNVMAICQPYPPETAEESSSIDKFHSVSSSTSVERSIKENYEEADSKQFKEIEQNLLEHRTSKDEVALEEDLTNFMYSEIFNIINNVEATYDPGNAGLSNSIEVKNHDVGSNADLASLRNPRDTEIDNVTDKTNHEFDINQLNVENVDKNLESTEKLQKIEREDITDDPEPDTEVSTINESHKTKSLDNNTGFSKLDDNSGVIIKDNGISEENEEKTDFSNDKNKKVQFSNRDLGFIRGLSTEKSNIITYPISQFHSKPSHDKNDLGVLPPTNADLLNDADESWPKDITFPTVRPSTSVCKSITSLGKIFEVEEVNAVSMDDSIEDKVNSDDAIQAKRDYRLTQPEEDNDGVQSDDGNVNENKYEFDKITKKKDFKHELNPIEATVAEKPESQELDVSSEKLTMFFNYHKINQIGQILQVDNYCVKPLSPLVGINNDKNQTKAGNYIDSLESLKTIKTTDLEQSDLQYIESQKNHQKTGSTYSKENPSKHRFEYKVNIETAPDWVRKGDGEPSEGTFEDFIFRDHCQSIKEYDLRKWCTDLEKSLMVMEKWSKWLRTASSNILYIQNNNKKQNQKGLREWNKLNKNVQKDAILWRKCHRKIEERLQIYSQRYNKVRDQHFRVKCKCKSQ